MFKIKEKAKRKKEHKARTPRKNYNILNPDYKESRFMIFFTDDKDILHIDYLRELRLDIYDSENALSYTMCVEGKGEKDGRAFIYGVAISSELRNKFLYKGESFYVQLFGKIYHLDLVK